MASNMSLSGSTPILTRGGSILPATTQHATAPSALTITNEGCMTYTNDVRHRTRLGRRRCLPTPIDSRAGFRLEEQHGHGEEPDRVCKKTTPFAVSKPASEEQATAAPASTSKLQSPGSSQHENQLRSELAARYGESLSHEKIRKGPDHYAGIRSSSSDQARSTSLPCSHASTHLWHSLHFS